MSLQENYQKLILELPTDVHLLVVSKNRSVQDIEVLYHLGQRHFGENRAQELMEKAQTLKHLSDIQWHMIGSLQTNKLKKILQIENLFAIHSVDRYSLVEAITKEDNTLKRNSLIALFWELNISGDKSKQGFSDLNSEVVLHMKRISNSKNFYNAGLMCMGTLDDDVALSKTKKIFQQLHNIKTDILRSQDLNQVFPKGVLLSMGMSHDYKIAISAGSQWIRVGSKLFA